MQTHYSTSVQTPRVISTVALRHRLNLERERRDRQMAELSHRMLVREQQREIRALHHEVQGLRTTLADIMVERAEPLSAVCSGALDAPPIGRRRIRI